MIRGAISTKIGAQRSQFEIETMTRRYDIVFYGWVCAMVKKLGEFGMQIHSNPDNVLKSHPYDPMGNPILAKKNG